MKENVWSDELEERRDLKLPPSELIENTRTVTFQPTTARPIEDYPCLDIRYLKRNGYLEWGSRKKTGWYVDGELVWVLVEHSKRFGHPYEGEQRSLDIFDPEPGPNRIGATVKITTTACTYGERPWFECPDCQRGCACLYLDNGTFTCRYCTGAKYLSTMLTGMDRLQEKRHVARRVLNFDEHGQAQRPKGMHLDTWFRRWQRYWDAEEAIAQALGVSIDALESTAFATTS